MHEKSIFHLFKDVCDAHANRLAFRVKKSGQWQGIRWREHFAAVKQISKSLLALGVQKGENICILSQSRLEWAQCDFGIVSVGAVVVGIYPSNLADECAYILNHAEAAVLFVENQAQLDKIISVRDHLPHLEHLILFDNTPDPLDAALTLEEFLAKADAVSDADFEARTEQLSVDDLATIVYTSGTTGVPKGAMLTHGNLVFTSWSILQSLYVKPDYETLLFLPLAHVFARVIVYGCMRGGMLIAFAEGMDKVAQNMLEVRPHFFASVPRIYEKVYEKITTSVEDAGGLKKRLFEWAMTVGREVSRLQQAKKSIPRALKARHQLATLLVFSKIQAALGGRIIYTISGAAPLNKAIAEFFHACGILILEGIGMTENTSFTNVNRYDHNKFGTVGPPGPLIEQKIAPDGEVLFRGKNIMAGYYKNPEVTAETIDKDGWLYTGDIGEIDDDNFLRITDRKKDLIITAGGKNIAPQRIERILRTSRYISQVVAVGDRRKFISAIITLDRPQMQIWATEQGLPTDDWQALVEHQKAWQLIEKEVAARNQELASYESVKKFTIIPEDFGIDTGELTPTLKLKRKVIVERYKNEIEAMYRE